MYGRKAGGRGSTTSSLNYKVPVKAHSCRRPSLLLSLWLDTAKHVWQWRLSLRPFRALQAACSIAMW